MRNRPTQKQLEKLPALLSTESVPLKDKVISMHFFMGGCDWYVVEYDQNDKLFWGFAILNGDLQNAEWGYFGLEELASIKVGFVEVDRDIHRGKVKASEVYNIAKAQGW